MSPGLGGSDGQAVVPGAMGLLQEGKVMGLTGNVNDDC